MTICERVFSLLKTHGKTQADLAAVLGVRQNTVSEWKRTGRAPAAEHIEPIAAFFDVSVGYIVTGKYDGCCATMLSQRHVDLLLFIERAEYAAADNIPAALLGERNEGTDTYAAIEYLKTDCGLIYEPPTVDVPATLRGCYNVYRLTERGRAYIDTHCAERGTASVQQGIFGNQNSGNTVTIGAGTSSEFGDELLRVYNGLSVKSKNALLTYAYELQGKDGGNV